MPYSACVLEVVPDFGVEEQGLGRNATDVEAGSAQHFVRFNERDLQSELATANRCCVSGRTAADDRHVIDRL